MVTNCQVMSFLEVEVSVRILLKFSDLQSDQSPYEASWNIDVIVTCTWFAWTFFLQTTSNREKGRHKQKFEKKIISALKDIKNQTYFMHKINRLLVAVVSWYNFKLIWLLRSLVSKTIKRKIRPTLKGKVEKQGTPAVVTLHNIPINNKLNLHYIRLVLQGLQKTDDITSVQNVFHYLYTSSSCVETGVTGKNTSTSSSSWVFGKFEQGKYCISLKNCNCNTRGRYIISALKDIKNPIFFMHSLSIRRFGGKRRKMEAKKGDSWRRETPDTDTFTGAFHPHTTWFDTIQSNSFRSLGCQLHVSKRSPEINLTFGLAELRCLFCYDFAFFWNLQWGVFEYL